MDGWREYIKQHMDRTGQHAAGVADRLDMTEGALRHWLNGTRTPSVDKFLDLCAAIGADPGKALQESFGRLIVAKQSSPTVNRILTAPTPTSAAHARFIDKMRAFKQNKSRAKIRR